MEKFSGVLLCLITMFMCLTLNAGACNGEARTALVTGMVFCDQCSRGSLSALSHPLPGAEVSLQCKQGLTTVSFFATTDENGVFSISVEEEEDGFEIHGAGRGCTVQLSQSNDMHCHVPTDMENGVSGATISSTGGVYRERAVYYVGPFAYRVDYPPEACNELKLNSRHVIRQQSPLLPVEPLRSSSSRGLKAVVDKGFRDVILDIPSTAVTMPSTAFSGTNPPSYNFPVTRPTPVDDNPSPVKPPEVPTGSNPSPIKCLLPPIPLLPELTKLSLHYPPCKTSPPQRGGIPRPRSPYIPSPIGSGHPPKDTAPKVGIGPPKDTAPKVGIGPPKDKSPSYGGSPMGNLPPPSPRKLKPTPPPTLSPRTPKRHPIHRPHPHHRSPPLQLTPPTPSPSPHKNPPSPNTKAKPPSPPKPLPPPAGLKPSPPLTYPPRRPPSIPNLPPRKPPSTPKVPPHHLQPPWHHKAFPSPSPPPQSHSVILPPQHPQPPQHHKALPSPSRPPQPPFVALPPHRPPPPTQYHKSSPTSLHTTPPKHPSSPPQPPYVPMPPLPTQYHKPSPALSTVPSIKATQFP